MPGDEPATSESVLVRRAKAGDLEAFEELVRTHEKAVFFLARRMLQNEHDAEDVTQQTFLNAIEHLSSFREESSVSTWLLRIATYAAIKVIRKRSRTTSLDASASEGYDGILHPDYIADWSQSPERLMAQQETRQIIQEALDTLDDKYRLVFLLRDVEEFSVRETAEMLNITEANVKVRLLRARLELRERLTQAFGDPTRRLTPSDHHH